MVSDPKISIIMPNFNKGKFIKDAIESVLDQSYSDFELIVVDDASSDDSIKTVQLFSQQNTKVRLIRLEKQHGASSARNLGIKNSRGELICLLDSDDIYSPVKLEKQFTAIRDETEPVIVYSEWWRIDENGAVLPPGKRDHPRRSGRIFGDVLTLGFGVNTTFMIPRSCLDIVGLYDETLPWAEDYDLVLRLAREFDFKHLDEPLYGYRNYIGNTRNALKRKERLQFQAYVMEKHLKLGGNLIDESTRRQVVSSLIRSFSLTGQYRKTLGYGLTDASAFKSMLRSIVNNRPIR